ncbi:hypothetical protein BDW22DRAFT_1360039 [Trametopsis cervina]|nr:hypothetical protein BDW22DRAFT_1360039 [Trametopsis cervina]
MLMLLATAHVSLSLRQLMEAFIDIPSPAPPLYSILYWLNETNGVNLAKIILYDTTVFMQDLVLIWRLYVVFARNWLVIVIPLIVEAVHMAAAYAATAIAVNHPITSPLFAHTALAGWSLDLVVNVCVTLAIAGRLWFFSRKIQPAVRTSGGKYQASIYTIVESGGLFAATTLAIVILYVRDSALIVNAMDVATQLACLTPMLIVVRIGFGITHGDARSTGTTAVSRPLAFGRNNYSMSRLDSTGQTVSSSVSHQ